VILDTTILYDSVVDGPRHLAAQQLLSEHDVWIAPDIIEFEMASALTRAVRRREFDAGKAQLALASARSILPALVPVKDLLSRAFALSLELDHPCADCIFLALAEREGDRMATADARFARKLADRPYAELVYLFQA
jgi:predicted nucleic acid-binding protein